MDPTDLTDASHTTTESDVLAEWPSANVCIVAVGPDGILASMGDLQHSFALASVTKPLIATATLVALEEGAIGLDDPCGPEGSTVRHLLSHASGLAPDEAFRIAAPAERRIYSNYGFEVLSQHLFQSSDIPAAQYLRSGVCEPLGMIDTELVGSPAHGAVSTGADLALWVQELLEPTLLLSPQTVELARTVQFPGLNGVLPGYGTQSPNDWGLGFEIRSHKSPHWTGHANSPETFGHFGKSGTFVWIDPVARLGVIGLGDAEFGGWAIDLWPRISDAILAEHALP